MLTDLCGRVLKEGKNPSRLFAVGLLSAVKQDGEVCVQTCDKMCVTVLRLHNACLYSQRFCQPSVLKYLLRLLRSKHYIAWKDTTGTATGPNEAVVKKSNLPSASPAAPAEYNDIAFPVLIANVLVQLLKVLFLLMDLCDCFVIPILSSVRVEPKRLAGRQLQSVSGRFDLCSHVGGP